MEWTKYMKGVQLWYLRKIVQKLPNKTQFDDTIQKMLFEVGPIPRSFSTERRYRDHLTKLQSSFTLVQAIESVPKMTEFNIPYPAQFFIAPYPKKNYDPSQLIGRYDAPVCDPALISWKFLSPRAEKHFAEARLSPNEFIKLKNVDVNFLVAESRVKLSLKKEFEDHWEWCQDVGYDSRLNSKQLANPLPLPVVKCETLLEGAFIDQAVDTLASNCLYSSRVHNFRVGDFVMVDHEKKTCYFFQVTLLDLKDHPVKVSVLEDVMNRLKIVEKGYTFHLIFVIDKAIRFPTGSKFTISEVVKNEPKEESVKATTLHNLKNGQKWEHFRDHVETTVVRAHLSLNILTGLPKEKSGPFHFQDSMKKSQLQELAEEYGLSTIGECLRFAINSLETS
jgi:hypothetical protein